MKSFEKVENLLVVVDMIKGFVTEGNMHDEYITHIIPGIRDLVKEYISSPSKEVFYIRDSHKADSLEFQKFPIHCLENTSESEMVDELMVYQDEVRTYLKNSTSAIFAPGLLTHIDSIENLKSVTIVGCCSDICVLNFALPLVNYFDENNKKIEIIVREDLIETYDAEYHKRDEYNKISKLLLKRAGVKLEKGRVSKNGR